MIKQTGTVSSYKELGEQFLNFVQRGNDTTQPWEVIDDRLDSFYGATIKFPVKFGKSLSDIKKAIGERDTDTNVSKISVIFPSIIGCKSFYMQNGWPFCSVTTYSHSKDRFDNTITSSECAVNMFSFIHQMFIGDFTRYVQIDQLITDGLTGSSFGVDNDNPEYIDRYFNINGSISENKDLSKLREAINNYGDVTKLTAGFSTYNINTISDIVYIPVNLTTFLVSFLEYDVDTLPSYFNMISRYITKLSNNIHNINPNALVIPIGIDMLNYTIDYLDYDQEGVYDRHISNVSIKIKNDMCNMFDNCINNSVILRFPDLSPYSQQLTSSTSAYYNKFTYDGKEYNYKFVFSCSTQFNTPTGYYIYNNNIVLDHKKLYIGSINRSPSIGDTDPWYIERYFHDPRDTWAIYYGLYSITNAGADYGVDIVNHASYDSNLYAYISLQYNEITPTTYNEWLTNTKDNYMSESFDSRRRIPATYGGEETWRTVTISNQYQYDIANIFKDTGEVLFISPHIKYDKNLWMCEQGGIACDQETRTQTIEDNCIRHRKLTQNFGGYESQTFVKVPPFPSLGCPMFTINAEQLDQGQINYYFIRDNASASIVIYVPSLNSLKYDYYVQHISFGVLDCFSISEQFMYPLYVGGGSGGLYHDHWLYYSPGSGFPSHEIGNIYKLDMENTSMSNSNILLSAKFNGANVSNFRVLCPDGHWDNIFNVSQNASLIVDPYECWPSSWTTRYYVLQQPIVGGSELGDARYGGTTTLNGVNSIKRIDTGYIEPEYRTTELDKYSKTSYVSTPIQPVIPVFSSHKIVSLEGWPRHRYGVLGKIPRCYSTWSRNLRFGELEINGKKFLAIPNAYDHRKWYPAYDVHVDFANLESYLKSKENTSSEIYNDFIYDYLLLSLED